MSAPIVGPVRAAELINDAVGELHQAQRLLDDLKLKIVDTWLARQLMEVDDRIYNALSKLGD